MTSNREFLTNLQPYNLESVTFGDGGKGIDYYPNSVVSYP